MGRVYFYDSKINQWEKVSHDKIFGTVDEGKGLLIEVNDVCKMGMELIPPQIPN